MEEWNTETGLSRAEFEKLTLYCNRSDNATDNRNRAVVLGFTAPGVKVAPGRIAHLRERGAAAWTTMDLAHAYRGRLAAYRRIVLFLRPDLVVVYDDLLAEKTAVFTWLAHTPEPA